MKIEERMRAKEVIVAVVIAILLMLILLVVISRKHEDGVRQVLSMTDPDYPSWLAQKRGETTDENMSTCFTLHEVTDLPIASHARSL